MDFTKMIMELPGEKRSQDVVEHTEWNSLWKQIVTQGNHSENYLHELYDYLFNDEKGWVYKVQAELDGVQPYLEGVMTQPVGKAPDGSLWTYPSSEGSTTPWGHITGDITKQQDLIQKFDTKSDVGHKHFGTDLVLKNGDIPGFVLLDGSIWEAAYGPESIPTNALKDLSVTSAKLGDYSVSASKIAGNAIQAAKIANAAVTAEKISYGALVAVKNFSIENSAWTTNSYGTYNVEVTLDGIDPAKHIGLLMLNRSVKVPDVDTAWSFSESMLDTDNEKMSCIFGGKITAVNELTLTAKEKPSGTIYLTLVVIHI